MTAVGGRTNGDPRTSLLEVRQLRTYFDDDGRRVTDRLRRRPEAVTRAVDGVNLSVRRGEILGLVGESGSGKTTLARTILGLTAPTSGEVCFDGHDVLTMGHRELRRLRRRMQMIFQDPHASLSPRQRVASILSEPYRINSVPNASRLHVNELLDMVELDPAYAEKFPHELSGGQARRVGIARALALRPDFIIADEPTSGLDVSAAASVLNLMTDLAKEFTLTYLLITHNLGVVGHVADRIAVMYLGKVVEVAPAHRLFDAPAHPYTQALLAAVPELDPARRPRAAALVRGEIPSPRNPPSGCRFHPRCPYAEQLSVDEEPELRNIAASHQVACHFWAKVQRERRAAGNAIAV